MTRRGRRLAATRAALTLALTLAGCGPDVVSGPTPSPTNVPLPTPLNTTYAPAATAWYAGFVVHVDSVASVLRAGTGTATVELRIENPGTNPAGLDAPIQLVAGTQAISPARPPDLPDIDPGGSAAASIPFDIEPGFDLGTAALRIGRPSEHVVNVPLVSGSGGLVTNDPQALAVPAAGVGVVAGSLRLTLESGQLRSDLPDWGLELPATTLALTLVYDARYVGQFSGGFAFTAANVGLKLPSGKVIAPRTDGQSQSAAVLLQGTTAAGLMSRFEVPVPGPGTYALVIRDGKATATIPIIIPVAPPPSPSAAATPAPSASAQNATPVPSG